jgi:hypothetical protein
MDMTKLDDFLSTVQSPSTRKSYRNGIKKFEEFFGRPIETFIGSSDAGKTVEKVFVWLKNKGTLRILLGTWSMAARVRFAP